MSLNDASQQLAIMFFIIAFLFFLGLSTDITGSTREEEGRYDISVCISVPCRLTEINLSCSCRMSEYGVGTVQ